MERAIKDKIRAFWDASPCGTRFARSKPGTMEFYASIEEHRYRTHTHIPELVDFARYKGKRILEIGCGVGTDLRQFARAGAKVVGIEASKNSIQLTREGFQLFGYQGNFLIGDGEDLGFKDNSFDLVYSFGVLHHTPDTQEALDEIYRVLRPGGEAIVMLYYRYSFNFIVNILLYEGIYQGKLKGASIQELLNKSTDGLDNPLAKVYSRKEARKMFHRFTAVKTYLRYLPPYHILGGRLIPPQILHSLERICGWHLIIKAVK